MLPAADQSVNLSGTWVPDIQRSDAQARKSNAYSPLVIVQTENEIQFHRTVNGRRDDESHRLDGEKYVIRALDGKELKIKATKLKGNSFEVTIEYKDPGGKSKNSRKYSLSEDGKILNVSYESNSESAGNSREIKKALFFVERLAGPEPAQTPGRSMGFICKVSIVEITYSITNSSINTLYCTLVYGINALQCL